MSETNPCGVRFTSDSGGQYKATIDKSGNVVFRFNFVSEKPTQAVYVEFEATLHTREGRSQKLDKSAYWDFRPSHASKGAIRYEVVSSSDVEYVSDVVLLEDTISSWGTASNGAAKPTANAAQGSGSSQPKTSTPGRSNGPRSTTAMKDAGESNRPKIKAKFSSAEVALLKRLDQIQAGAQQVSGALKASPFLGIIASTISGGGKVSEGVGKTVGSVAKVVADSTNDMAVTVYYNDWDKIYGALSGINVIGARSIQDAITSFELENEYSSSDSEKFFKNVSNRAAQQEEAAGEALSKTTKNW